MLPFLQRHWFLTLLIVVLAIGLWQGPAWADGVEQFPRGWLVASVMFLTALPMAFTQLTSVLRRGQAVGLALLISMAVAPPVAWLCGRMLPPSLAVGLLVAAAVPCTLASAAVWTRRGGGNDAVALAVTFITNLACFLVLPFWLWLFLRAQVPLDAVELSSRLLLLVVAPVVVAQLLRLIPTIAITATNRKIELSLAAQLGILAMVFMGATSAGKALSSMDAGSIGATVWLSLLSAVTVLHLFLFALGWWASGVTGAERPDRIAVAISGSQKTLMIGLDVALEVTLDWGGLVVLPMVAYHVVQLVVDTLLVDRLHVDRTHPQ